MYYINNIKRYMLIFIVIILIVSNFNINSIALDNNANVSKSKSSFNIHLRKYTPSNTQNQAGILGEEIYNLYPGQQFAVTVSMDNFNGGIDGYEGIAGVATAIKYDSGVLEYIGLPGAGVSQDASVGGDSSEIDQYYKDIFDLSLIDDNTNGRIKYSKSYYENILVEYPTILDYQNANSKLRSVYSGPYYKGNTYEESRIFKSSNLETENNNILTFLFKVKENYVKTPGLNTLEIDKDSITISYYNAKNIGATNYLTSETGANYIYDHFEIPKPVNPDIVLGDPEGITDTINHDNGTRTITVQRLSGLDKLPSGTTIKVYAPDGNTLLGEATSTQAGSLTVNIDRGSNDKNAIINLGGDYKVTAHLNQLESNKITHNVPIRENYVKADRIFDNVLAEIEKGGNLDSLPKSADNIYITYNPNNGLEEPAYKTTLELENWSFVNPNDSNTSGQKEVKAKIKDKGNIKNKNNFHAKGKVDIISSSKIILKGGNALPEDITAGIDTNTTMYVYYGHGFRDNFVALDDDGNDVTDQVERKIIINNNENTLNHYSTNESLTFFTDNAGDLKSFIKKEFNIEYSYTKTDGQKLTASRKVVLIHRLGDINRDGNIDSIDQKIINDYVLSLDSPDLILNDPLFVKFISDTDRNSETDFGDSSDIKQHIYGNQKINQYYTFLAQDEKLKT